MRADLRRAAILLALPPVVLLFCAASGQTEEVDCGSLGFSYEPVEEHADALCGRARARAPDGASAVYEQMVIDYDSGAMYILEARAGSKTFFQRRSLQRYIKEFVELREVEAWFSDAEFGDFETARFLASMVDQPVSCFAFLSVGPRRFSQYGSYTGPGSFMVGYWCRFGSEALDRSVIEETLSRIR